MLEYKTMVHISPEEQERRAKVLNSLIHDLEFQEAYIKTLQDMLIERSNNKQKTDIEEEPWKSALDIIKCRSEEWAEEWITMAEGNSISL